jgi:hypothetical protein
MQEFTSFRANAPSNVVRAHLHSYTSLAIWLLTHPSTPSLCLSSTNFLTTFYIHLDIPHPTIVDLSRC